MNTVKLRRTLNLIAPVVVPTLMAVACEGGEESRPIDGAGGTAGERGGQGGGGMEEVGGESGTDNGGGAAGSPMVGMGGSGGGGQAGSPGDDPPDQEFCADGALEEGLLGYWKFDEGLGSAIADSTENGNDGLVVEGNVSDAGEHAAPQWDSGKSGKALKLDGSDDWVRVPASASIDETGDLNAVSVSAWVNIERLNTEKDFNFVVLRHEVGSRLEHFGLGMFQGLPTSAVHFFYASGPQQVALGEWVHLAMTYDGITERVYVNGDEVAFLDIGWPIVADETPVTIGAAINEVDVIENIAGMVDEVRLYNRELLPCEVNQLALD